MARKTRFVAAAACAAGLLALVAVPRDTGTRRRLGGPGALPTHALLPEHQRKWVQPAGQPVAHHVHIGTHDRTAGYKPAGVWQSISIDAGQFTARRSQHDRVIAETTG